MRRRKANGEASEPVPAKTNGFDPDKVKSFVSRVENLLADLDKEKSDFMNACKVVHGDIKLVYQEAKDEAGIPKKELKAVVKARVLERKAERVRDELESEQQDNFDLIRHALGDLADTPLGAAAMQTGQRVAADAAP